MPPKVRITREDIVQAAVKIVRSSGAQALNARIVAAMLDCSTQPVFSNFENMDALRLAVVEKADGMCNAYIQREIEKGEFPQYKASGMAHIRFAREEKELFRLLYMRDRTEEQVPSQMVVSSQMETLIQKNTGLSGDRMRLFHLEMWAYVHGIATMFATGYLDMDWDLVSQMLTDAYQGLKKQYAVE